MSLLLIGRAGFDVDLRSPWKWNVSGDEASIEVSLLPDATATETAPALSKILVQQLAGLVGNPDEPVVPVTWDAWPAVDGWYEVVDLDVAMVGSSLAHGLWRLSGRLRRVSAFASPVHEARLLHVRRSGTAVASGSADPLHGIPGAATVYRRDTVGLGALTSRSVGEPDGSAGTVKVNVWADTDAQANAEFQVEPADAYEGACRFRIGPALTPPSILHRASSWWDARSYSGSGDLLDLVGSVDGTFEEPTPGRGPLFCPVADRKYAFFPGWADEGATSSRITTTGLLDVRVDCDDHGLDVGGPNFWPVHLGSDADELGFAVGFDSSDGTPEMRVSPDGSFVGTAVATAAPTLGNGGQRRWVYNPTSGDVTFYERASGDPESDVGWVQIGTVVSTPGGAWHTHASQELWISGTDDFDGEDMNMRGFLRRLVIYVGGTLVKDFDPHLADREDATFTGGAGETWTWFRASSTSSYRVDVVGDRPCFELGNGAHFAFGDNFDVPDSSGGLTVSWWGWHQSDTPTSNGWVGKIAAADGSAAGYLLADIASVGGQGGSMLSLPGPVVGQGGFPSQVATGVLAVWTAVFDRDADDLTLYRDGTAASAIDISSVGSVGNAVDFAIGLTGGLAGQMAFGGAAVWSRALTSDEIDLLVQEATGEDVVEEVPEANTYAEQFARYHDVLGRQVPGDVDPGEGWLLTNGLVTIAPATGLLYGSESQWVVLSWAGSAWESATVVAPFVVAGDPLPGSFSGLSLLRNGPEQTTIRIHRGAPADNAVMDIDLTVRRGHRLVHGYMVWNEQNGNVLGVGPEPGWAGTTITSGIRQTSNDADGNRGVFVTAKASYTTDTGGGYIYKATSDRLTFDFGVGHEIGGSGASGIETAAALAAQYAAYVSERCDVVAP